MEESEAIDLDRDGAVAIVTLRNPKRRNAFTPEMRRELTSTLVELNKAVEVRAIVLTGAGQHFCVGGDTSRMSGGENAAAPRTAVQNRENTKDVNQLLAAIIGAPKPVIAAVEGDAFGGGMSIALACDFIVAARNARFGTAFGRIGLLPDLGMLYTLPLRLGMARAKRLMMTSGQVSGEAGHGIGLVDELTEPGGARDAALDLAREIAVCAPLPVGYIKAAYADGIENWRDAVRVELDFGSGLSGSDDFREGLAALREKRTPRYRGC